jgi:hypothetical protein
MADNPGAPPPPLTRFEIAVHGLADGIAGMYLLGSLRSLSGRGAAESAFEIGLPCLVLALSVVVLLRRFQPDRPALRRLERGLAGLLVVSGAVLCIASLVFLVSGTRYRGSSPDVGGLEVGIGFLFYFPMAVLLLLPFLLNVSRLTPRARWRLLWACIVLGLLPLLVLAVAIRTKP